MFIVLTWEGAAMVSSPILQPRPLIDGTFAINAAVLDDPYQINVRDILVDLPQIDLETLTTLLPPDPE